MMNFVDTGLKPTILTALEELGFEKTTPIQEKCIPHLLNSKQDLIALAQTGTGKTAAFSLPILQQIDVNSKHIQAIILCPTRELCLQIKREIDKFIKYIQGMDVVAIYGGDSVSRQLKDLRNNPQIVVGTPGRVRDFISRKKLKLDNLDFLVLDEADEMLNMGFQEELEEILGSTPREKQSLFFSATMPSSMKKIAKRYLNKFEVIETKGALKGADSVSHLYYVVHEQDRYEALRRVLDYHSNIYTIIFCRTRQQTERLAEMLKKDEFMAEYINGDLSQNQRQKVMRDFKNQQFDILIATDVAARGIDVDDLTHVINYYLPDSLDTYIHRSGRTGRAHSKGISLSFINMREKYRIRKIEKSIGKEIEKGLIPNGNEICEKVFYDILNEMEEIEVMPELDKMMPNLSKKLTDFDSEEIIKRFFSLYLKSFVKRYDSARDLNKVEKRGRRDRDSKGSSKGKNFKNFELNVGRKDGVNMAAFFSTLKKLPDFKKVKIGRINIEDKKVKFEVLDRSIDIFERSLSKPLQFKGKKVKVFSK